MNSANFVRNIFIELCFECGGFIVEPIDDTLLNQDDPEHPI